MGLIRSLQENKASIRVDDLPKIIGSWVANVSPVQMTEKSYTQLVDAYKSWVYTSVDKIAKAVAMIPLGLYVYREKGKKSGGKILDPGFQTYVKSLQTKAEQKYYLKQIGITKEQIMNHPFLDLIHKPNNLMTRFMLWYETMVRMEVGGFCGWYMPTNSLKMPGMIFPLPLTKFALLKPKVKSTLEIEYWEYQDGNVTQRFAPQDVMMLKYPHPASPFMGMSPLMAQTYPYDIDLFLMQQQRAFFDNMALPGLHLSTDQKLTPKQVQEITEIINEQYSTAVKAGKTLVTHSGLKKEAITMSGRDAMIDKVAEDARDRLITSYDLSPGKVGLVKDVNRANSEALNESFINECLRPKCMLIEETIETFLLPRYDKGLFCDFTLPDISDKEHVLTERQQNLATFYTSINEERIEAGKEPVPWGDQPWIPFTLSQNPGEGKPSSEPPPEKGQQFKSLSRTFWTEDRKTIYWKIFVKRVDSYKHLVEQPMKIYFKTMKEEVMTRLHENGYKLFGEFAGWSRGKVAQSMTYGRHKAIVSEINIQKSVEVKKLKDQITPIVKHIMSEIGQHRIHDLLETFKLSMNFNVNDPAVLKWLGQRMQKFSQEVTNNSFESIEVILKEGFTNGLPVSEIAETLRLKFESWDEYRASLIAQTETIAAMNQADIEGVRQSGMGDQLLKGWLSSRDDHVRPSHQEADQEYSDGISIDDTFQVGDDEMDAPGEGTDPGENINCLLPGNIVSGNYNLAIRSNYSGEAIEIKTMSGKKLSLTPNHPVLTSEGFVSAGLLHKGDNLITDSGIIYPFSPISDNYQNQIPTLIEDVFNSIFKMGSLINRRLTGNDLHGDASSIIGQVDVVGADGKLAKKRETSFCEQDIKFTFMQKSMSHSQISGSCPSNLSLDGVFLSPSCFPSGRTLFDGSVSVKATPFQFFRFGTPSYLDIFLSECSYESISRNPGLIRNLLQRYSGLILIDEIVEIRNFDYCGHVYDLQSDNGFIITNSIAISNCRCTLYYMDAETEKQHRPKTRAIEPITIISETKETDNMKPVMERLDGIERQMQVFSHELLPTLETAIDAIRINADTDQKIRTKSEPKIEVTVQPQPMDVKINMPVPEKKKESKKVMIKDIKRNADGRIIGAEFIEK